MTAPNPYTQYQQNAVNSAKPGELTLMLYDGLVRFIKLAIISMDQNNSNGAHTALVRAQEIITHLRETLDHDYELADNLEALYAFMNRHLLAANVKKSPRLASEVLELALDLRHTWQQALMQL